MKPPPALPKEEYVDETMEQLKAMGEYVLDAEKELENEREKSLEEKNLKVTYDREFFKFIICIMRKLQKKLPLHNAVDNEAFRPIWQVKQNWVRRFNLTRLKT
jgi:hypothetical protein